MMANRDFNITANVRGADEVMRNLSRYSLKYPRAFGQGLTMVGEAVRKTAQGIVPLDTGNLRSSGRLEKTKQFGAVTEVLVIFGGSEGPFSVIYAADVHETNRNYRNGRTWKYLEKSLRFHLRGMEKGIANHVRSTVR